MQLIFRNLIMTELIINQHLYRMLWNSLIDGFLTDVYRVEGCLYIERYHEKSRSIYETKYSTVD